MKWIIFIVALCFTQKILANDIAEAEKIKQNSIFKKVKYIDTTINQLMKQYDVPGASITVIKDREILWSQSYGFKDVNTQVKVSNQTMFQAASISKPITALATLNLAKDGLLNINKPVNQYIKHWKIPNYKASDTNPILIKQLINHTSGLSVHGFAGYQTKEMVPSLIEVLNGASILEQVFSLKNVNSAPIEVIDTPGEQYKYSGGGYSVLQQVLLDYTGDDFSALMHKNIFLKLKMKNSTFQQPVTDKLTAQLASGHIDIDDTVDGKYHIYPEQAAAGLWTTSEDLAKVLIDIQKSLFDDSGLMLSKSFAEKMTTPSFDTFLGLGFFLRNVSNQIDNFYFYHDGRNKGFSSSLLGHKDGYGVVILTNTNQPSFNNEVMTMIMGTYDWL